ncbi:MAG TPA: TMEM175 family protein [Casimicrobiaceae bacterium]|nr:TMEM175 family protein [Casimicrobiaceae bacterium]
MREFANIGGLGKQRLEALVDGICAVAMTLLVLDLKLPDDIVLASDQALWERLVGLERHFVIYVITFFVTGMYWYGHHLQFHFVRTTNRVLIWLNLLWLLLVSFLPFATDLVGDHKTLVLPCEIYGATLLALSLVAFSQARYLARHPALATAHFTPDVMKLFEMRAAIFAIVPILSMLVAFENRRLALYVYLLLLCVHRINSPIHEHIVHARSDDEARPEGVGGAPR